MVRTGPVSPGKPVYPTPGDIGRLAREALEEEVSVTPKPGLVDRRNSGAHQDMDYETFLISARVLEPYFRDFAREGFRFDGDDPEELFARARRIGVEAEAAMFEATGGVNTHKGLIFSLGILCAAAGAAHSSGIPLARRPAHTPAGIRSFAARMVRGIVERDLEGKGGRPSAGETKGEGLYRRFGIRGIRGEAESGFATTGVLGLPWLRKLSTAYPGRRNDVLLSVLLRLMTGTTDTNVLGRHDFSALEYVQNTAARALGLGGPFTDSGRRFIERMDRDFIARNISPGGSADLLGVTIFLDRLQRRNFPSNSEICNSVQQIS